MKSKIILTVAATLLAGTMFAAAQQDGAPGNERDRSGATTDASQNSAYPLYMPEGQGTVGQGRGADGTVGFGGARAEDRTPLQPGGISPSEPPQTRGQSANPRPR